MSAFASEYYLWLKAIHIIFVIAWMAGMFYLPRLYVYHCQVTPNSEADETFKVMERKLLKVIMNPAMIVSFITGILLIIATGCRRARHWLLDAHQASAGARHGCRPRHALLLPQGFCTR